MPFQPWKLAAMEERGYMDTNDSLITRVALYLANSPNDVIDTAEFRQACIASNVDPDSFSQRDLQSLQRKLNRIT